ncbi:MAG: hypothetical protein E6J05_08950 [Chloroflexi bacterium]|nr:MAG: hypothetical protein E6J05_08950 [Chloroflexota bacterium]
MKTDAAWHHGQTLAAGQVAEFKVWAELVRQSMGGLHVFLPLRDMGIDGVVHRLSDGDYLPVQVKARTSLTPAGQVHITVTASSIHDDEALMVCVLVDAEQLGAMVLVVPEAKFRELAAHDIVEGREYLTAAFQLHAGGRSRWALDLVPREGLAERFGGALALTPSTDEVLAVDRGSEGFLGESEVVRRLAESPSLNLFRPFPDLETVEVLARHVDTHRFMGLQVKTAGWERPNLENRVYVRRSSFRARPTTYMCVLSWDRVAMRFGDDCLLIPSLDISELARAEGEWLVLEMQPGSAHHRRLDRYQTPLAALGRAAEALLAASDGGG